MSSQDSPITEKGRAGSHLLLRFVGQFAVLFALFIWLFDGDGPLQAINVGVGWVTQVQARLAGALLAVLGDAVTTASATLSGPSFACEVDTGCNGMTAVVLLAAGIMSFPSTWKRRLVGLAVLVPCILAVNTIRVAALFWTGVHAPRLFAFTHVYVWQVLVVTMAGVLWVIWLSWTTRWRSAS